MLLGFKLGSVWFNSSLGSGEAGLRAGLRGWWLQFTHICPFSAQYMLLASHCLRVLQMFLNFFLDLWVILKYVSFQIFGFFVLFCFASKPSFCYCLLIKPPLWLENRTLVCLEPLKLIQIYFGLLNESLSLGWGHVCTGVARVLMLVGPTPSWLIMPIQRCFPVCLPCQSLSKNYWKPGL